MTISFLGQFLLLKGIVSRAQIHAAMNLQREVNQPLAQVAQVTGLLSEQQLQQLPLAGCENDTLFSQVAINLGWINPLDLEAHHAQQRKAQLTLAKALVKCGYLNDNSLANLLTDYHYWNLRNLQRFGAVVSASEFASEADTFSFALTQYMRKVYGLHVKPYCADNALPSNSSRLTWQIDLATKCLNIIVPEASAGISYLLKRAELIGSLELPRLCENNRENLEDIPSAMSPTQFFASLLQLLLADLGGQGIRQLDTDSASATTDALTQKRCLRCCYSLEGELFDVYFCLL